MIGAIVLGVFVALFILFLVLGFLGRYFRKGDLTKIHEWALAGRKLGTALVWFLVGGDLYTAYTFIAVPSGIFAKGSIYFFAVPYVSLTFAVAMLVMPRLWTVSKKNGYVTAGDFVRDKFNSRSLAILIAITGIVAELPYIALQVVGMRAILISMLTQFGSVTETSGIALIIAFILLAFFTYTSGLRGATLTAVMKDIIIFTTIIVILAIVPLAYGGFHTAFSTVKSSYVTLPLKYVNAFWSLFLLSAFALYLYPHAVTGALSSVSAEKLRMSTALLPIYGIGLALLALFGILVYAVPSAMSMLAKVPLASRGVLVVPTLIATTMPSWFTGFAFLGIFIGGLVPAAIMAISQANLLTRNIIKEFKPNLKPKTEAKIAKIAMVCFEFLALGFVFIVPATYAISLQLFGGVIILQTLPAVFLGLYLKSLNKYALIAGWFAGIFSGIYFVIAANHFGLIRTTLMQSPVGLLFAGTIALAINLLIVFVWSGIAKTAQTSVTT